MRFVIIALSQGVNYTFGLEPGVLGSLGFYAPGWDYRQGPVQARDTPFVLTLYCTFSASCRTVHHTLFTGNVVPGAMPATDLHA